MIIWRNWVKVKETDGKTTRYLYEGYFLFGVVPLYINIFDLSCPAARDEDYVS